MDRRSELSARRERLRTATLVCSRFSVLIFPPWVEG